MAEEQNTTTPSTTPSTSSSSSSTAQATETPKKKRSPLNYFKGVGRELKRVRWPDRKTYFSSLAVVLVIAVVAGLILFVEDLASESLVDLLRDAFESLRS